VLNNIAAIADIRRDYQKAEDYYLLSLPQAEKSEDKEMMTNVLSNLSLISWKIADLTKQRLRLESPNDCA
jgi:hypothetical protein